MVIGGTEIRVGELVKRVRWWGMSDMSGRSKVKSYVGDRVGEYGIGTIRIGKGSPSYEKVNEQLVRKQRRLT